MSTNHRRSKEEVLELVSRVRELTAEGRCSREIEQILGVPRKYIQKLYLRYDIPHVKRGGAYGAWNGAYNGGRHLDKTGYVLILMPDHPYAVNGYVREHRLVMEQKLGRYLLPTEVVHHINDNKQDNRPENLELFSSNKKHLQKTLKGKCPNWSEEGRQRILVGARNKRKKPRD